MANKNSAKAVIMNSVQDFGLFISHFLLQMRLGQEKVKTEETKENLKNRKSFWKKVFSHFVRSNLEEFLVSEVKASSEQANNNYFVN